MRRRALTPLIVLLVFLGLVAWAHLYFIQRLVLAPDWAEPLRVAAAGAIAALGASLLAAPTVERLWRPGGVQALSFVGYLWMGMCFYLLLGLWTSDLVMWLGGWEGQAAARVRAVAVAATVGLLGAVGVASATRGPRVKRVELKLPGWPPERAGYRIVQISDVHIGPLLRRRFAERVVARCNALQADLIAVTGDLVDGSVRDLRTEVEPFAALRARDGVFFVTGNHDHYSNARRWTARVQELGMQLLRNRRVRIGEGEHAFELAGIDDRTSGTLDDGPGQDLERALAGRDPERPLVLLAHDPRAFGAAARAGVTLQLSGHTHGGQLWPFNFLVRLQTRYVAGLYRAGASLLYVSRGTGYWGPPMRIASPAEITELVLG